MHKDSSKIIHSRGGYRVIIINEGSDSVRVQISGNGVAFSAQAEHWPDFRAAVDIVDAELRYES